MIFDFTEDMCHKCRVMGLVKGVPMCVCVCVCVRMCVCLARVGMEKLAGYICVR